MGRGHGRDLSPLQNICFMVQSRSFITTNYTNDTK